MPNGTYTVKIVAGDAATYSSIFKIKAENVLVVDGTPTTANRFVEGTRSVTVMDGRLTLTSELGAYANKLNYIEVTQTTAGPAPVLPSVTVAASAMRMRRVGCVACAGADRM